MTDEQLMDEYSFKDDIESFNIIYNKYASIIYGYLAKKIFNQTNVDEIFQDIFVKFHQSRKQYNSKFPFRAWLFTIVRSCMFDYFRKIQSADTLNQNFKDFLLTNISEIEDTAFFDLELLKESDKELLQKRYLEEWSFNEIAAQLEISESTVRQRISRAVKSLRSKYVRI